jgi:hypothetical protein
MFNPKYHYVSYKDLQVSIETYFAFLKILTLL